MYVHTCDDAVQYSRLRPSTECGGPTEHTCTNPNTWGIGPTVGWDWNTYFEGIITVTGTLKRGPLNDPVVSIAHICQYANTIIITKK